MAGCKHLCISLLLLLFYCQASANEFERFNTKPFRKRFGVEFSAYPAGQIYGLRAEFVNKSGWELNFRIGYNRAFRKNFSGLNDDEQGGGYGASVGIRYHAYDLGFAINDNTDAHLVVGTRVDFWKMDIFWKDWDNVPASGKTIINVLQPTFDIGLLFTLNQKWLLTVYGGVGQEINVVTKGDAVGQGGMWLGGIILCRNLWYKKNN